MREGLTFRQEDHRYFWRGRPVMNVTRALSLVTDYSRIPPDVLKNAQDEGIAIHKTVELYCKGDLHEPSLPEWLVPRLDAFKRFVAETGFVLFASEERVYHDTYDYAGQLDLVGTLRKRMGRKEVDTASIVDIKRSFYGGRAIGLQTHAYLAAWNCAHKATMPALDRYALQLRGDGTYRLEPFTQANDFNDFLAVLATARIKESMQ